VVVVVTLLGLMIVELPAPKQLAVGAGRSATTTGPGSDPFKVRSSTRGSVTAGLPAVEAGVLPWQLAAPISREVVLPSPPNQAGGRDQLVIAGGLDSAGSSVSGIFTLSTSNGHLTLIGSLAVPTHDAAGTVVGGLGLVLGGGTTALAQIGMPRDCVHNPPTALGSPNGDTPLADGDLLVSEINGSWVDDYTPTGRLVWETHVAIGYPSDPQQTGPGTYLVADYEDPGAIIEFNRQGRVLYRYQPTSGPGLLNHPSLVELLPSGVFMLNDDYNDRMVAIDPVTGALVWQYGVTGKAGTSPGLLDTPDGFDVLGPGGSTPTHMATG
jgi:outer membrane protein assembly factor BamB